MHCPACGRFAQATEERGYDGQWDQIWVTTKCSKCSKCGTITESIV